MSNGKKKKVKEKHPNDTLFNHPSLRSALSPSNCYTGVGDALESRLKERAAVQGRLAAAVGEQVAG